MSIEPPNDIDRAAIEEQAQRTVEQAALRKVRKTLDRIDAADAAGRRALRYALIVCALLAGFAAWLFWGLLFGGGDMPKQPPMKIPGAAAGPRMSLSGQRLSETPVCLDSYQYRRLA